MESIIKSLSELEVKAHISPGVGPMVVSILLYLY